MLLQIVAVIICIAFGIVRGNYTVIENYPFLAIIIYRGELKCTGLIIDEKTVLTTDVCVGQCDTNPTEYFIHAGSTDLISGGDYVSVNSSLCHPDRIFNNVALLKLQDSLQFGPKIQPVKRPDSNPIYQTWDLATLIGWGIINNGQPTSPILRRTDVVIVDIEFCQLAYEAVQVNVDTEKEVCAGIVESGVCYDKFVGPLLINGELLGIMSWIYGCDKPGMPAVFVLISEYSDWIWL